MRFLLIIFMTVSMSASAQNWRIAEASASKGIEFWKQREYDSAEFWLSRAIQHDTNLDEAYSYRADVRASLGNIDGAILDYTVYLTRHPEDRDALFSWSTLHYRAGHYDQAMEGFLQLKKMPAGETNRIYYRQRPGEEGISGMFTAQSNDLSYIDNYLGLACMGLGDFSRSLDYFDSALHIQPDNVDYLVNRGRAHLRSGDRRKAEADFQNALSHEPENERAREALAQLLREGGDSERAIELYSEAIGENPSSTSAYQQRGYAHLLSGQNKEAIADFDESIRRNPGEPTTWLNRGIALMRLNFLEEAFDDFSEAINLAPNMASAYMNRGNALYKMGELERALNDYSVAIIYDKKYYLAYYHKGIAEYRLGAKEKACASLRFAAVNGIKEAIATEKRICQ